MQPSRPPFDGLSTTGTHTHTYTHLQALRWAKLEALRWACGAAGSKLKTNIKPNIVKHGSRGIKTKN